MKKLLPNPAGEETTPFADGHYVYMEDLTHCIGRIMPFKIDESATMYSEQKMTSN